MIAERIYTLDDYKLLNREDLEDVFAPFHTFKQKPFWHQLVALAYGYSENNIGLFFEMGLGKSKTSIDWLQLKGIDQDILVVTLNEPLAKKWVDEFHENSKMDGITVFGTKQQRKKLIQSNQNFYIINYEGLNVLLEDVWNRRWKAIIVDESRQIKNPDAIRTKILLELSKRTPHRAILTGTPTVKPQDIFCQFKFLNHGAVFGRDYRKFRKHWFNKKTWGRYARWELKPELEEDFVYRIHSNALRFTKDECLDLPEKTFIDVPIVLPTVQREDYNALLQQKGNLSLGDLDVGQLENVYIKFSQITGGFVKINGKVRTYGHNAKIDFLMDIVLEAIEDTKVTIFHRFVPEGRIIEAALAKHGLRYSSLRGETRSHAVDELDRFLKDDRTRIMVAHPKSGGAGLDFVNSRICVFYSMDYNLEHRKQAEDRLHRIKQKNPVTYYFLLCENTIDYSVLQAHEEGFSLMDKINNNRLKVKDVC